MLKWFKTVAIVVIVLIFAAACASVPEDELIPEFGNYDENEGTDLGGYEFIMASARAGSENPINPQSGNTARGDRLIQRYKDTEEKFNVKITVLDECSVGDLVVRSAAGMKYADLMAVKINEIVTGKYIQNGYFIPFSGMNIDLDSGIYGPPNMLEGGYFAGEYYGIISYYWGFPAADTMPAMWFNPRVISNYRQTSPHELDEQGEWTWATLEKMCEAIHDTSDPDPEKRTYALAYTSEPYLEFAALYSNNARVATKGADGRLSYALNSKEAAEAMNFLVSLAERDLICDGGNRQNITPFIENRRAFFVEYTHLGLSDEGADNLSYRMEEAYEWIYFPEGPSGAGTKSRTAYSFWTRFMYATLNTDPNVMEILLPYMFQPLPGETTETWQDDFRRTTFFTEESFDYFQILRDEAFFDYTAYTPFTDVLQPRLLAMTRGTASVAETLESIGDKMQASLDKLYNDYVE